jgi:NAD(P)-dependent dehydrogenase (short-subunit alcohol dehydrogenase family)
MHKKIIVTGATGNLGSAVVSTFLNTGDVVFGVGHKKESLHLKSQNHWHAGVDLQDANATGKLIQEIFEKEQVIDMLVCTAGGFISGKQENVKEGDILEQIQLNFMTCFNIVQAILPHLIKQGKGKIFLVGSKPGFNMEKGSNSVAYALSKSLIFRLAEILNYEYRSSGISTYVIVPGTIDTPENRATMPNQNFAKWVSPDTIAETIKNYIAEPAVNNPIISF